VDSAARILAIATGALIGLIGLGLAIGGAWLTAIGGSLYYLVAGLGLLLSGGLLIARRREALWVSAAVLIGTLAWSV
jgi:quinoprotein glucose dehydrogenase